jgi:RNA polymerase sigma factor (sigma-70 family)
MAMSAMELPAPTTDARPPAGIAADRPRLLAIAYRMLGSAAEAEDAVQEAYARWYALANEDRAAIRSPSAWLATVVSRICLDLLGSARARRERYVGPWLPEPVPGDELLGARAAADPAERVTLDESLSLALLVVLEALTPAERVAFILHDAFGYPFADIAAILGRTPAACRQLASSARRRVEAARPSLGRPAPGALVAAVKRAWDDGDVERLVGLLAPDAVAVVDGGGEVSAPTEPVTGARAVAALLLGVREREPRLTVAVASVNGAPGLVAHAGGEVLAAIALAALDGRVHRLWAVRHPRKLARWRGSA